MNITTFLTQHIKKNQKYFLNLEKKIQKENNLEKKCILAYDAATFAISHTTDIFSSEIIEETFLKLAQANSIELPQTFSKGTVLHVLTEAYNSGGHTRCVERWIQQCTKQHHSCIILNQRKGFSSRLKKVVDSQKGEWIVCNSNDSFLKRALDLRQYASRFEYVILHVHMNDPIPLLAFGTKDFKRPILFFNHADHAFWLGVSIADHIADIFGYGHQITLNNRQTERCSLLGVPSDSSNILTLDKQTARKKLGIPSHTPVVFSSGSATKYDPINQISFYFIIKDLLVLDPNIQFYIAGVKANRSFWKKINKEFPDNVHCVGRLDYQTEYPLYLSSSDIVLNSYPVGGGTAMLDAIKAKKPFLSLARNMDFDYLARSKGNCKNYQELIENVLKALHHPDYAQEIYESVYKEWEKDNSLEKWKEKYLDILNKLPQEHSIYTFNRKVNQKVSQNAIETARWTETGSLSFLSRLKKWRKNYLKIHLQKHKKEIKILGLTLIDTNNCLKKWSL